MTGCFLFVGFWLLSIMLVGAIFYWPATAAMLLPIGAITAVVFVARTLLGTRRS